MITIVVSGNPINGYKYDGPFDSEDEAIEWAVDAIDNPYWWTAPMTRPEIEILEACGQCGSYVICECDDKVIDMPPPPVPTYTLK